MGGVTCPIERYRKEYKREGGTLYILSAGRKRIPCEKTLVSSSERRGQGDVVYPTKEPTRLGCPGSAGDGRNVERSGQGDPTCSISPRKGVQIRWGGQWTLSTTRGGERTLIAGRPGGGEIRRSIPKKKKEQRPALGTARPQGRSGREMEVERTTSGVSAKKGITHRI